METVSFVILTVFAVVGIFTMRKAIKNRVTRELVTMLLWLIPAAALWIEYTKLGQ